jgi:hypothetical protein
VDREPLLVQEPTDLSGDEGDAGDLGQMGGQTSGGPGGKAIRQDLAVRRKGDRRGALAMALPGPELFAGVHLPQGEKVLAVPRQENPVPFFKEQLAGTGERLAVRRERHRADLAEHR